MTRVPITVLFTATALVMLAAAPARSAEAVNGLSTNGISLNGISLNGISLNGMSPNVISPNGISPNGVASVGSSGGERTANSAGEIGQVIAVELPRRPAQP